MSCRQSRKWFGNYWDDELSAAEREWLEGHFATCASCRTEYEEFARGLEMLAELPRAEVRPGMAERALERARRAPTAPDLLPTGDGRRWIALTATAALIAVATATVLEWSGSGLLRRRDTGIQQPALRASAPATVRTEPAAPLADQALVAADDASFPDSLFDHDEDVEFVLDPVSVRKGRAHPPSKMAPDPARGAQAVITF